MDLALEKQVVFVAGSSRGIGRSIGEALLSEGASVVLTGRDKSSLENTRIAFENAGHGARMLAIDGDFSIHGVIAPAIERTVQKFGRIDHLVVNLGSGAGKPGWDQGEQEWARLFEHNFFAATRLAEAALPRLLANAGGGSILFVASIVGVEATPAPLPYSAAKAALINYSKNLARQLGPSRVRVNTIAPGNVLFAGGSWERRLSSHPADVESMLLSEVPQQRFGTPQEIASLAVFLCSSRAAFCTGGCYVVDGGQTRSI